MLSLASEAEVNVQVEEDFLTSSETREGAGAAETREPTAAKPRSWMECIVVEILVNRMESQKNEWVWSTEGKARSDEAVCLGIEHLPRLSSRLLYPEERNMLSFCPWHGIAMAPLLVERGGTLRSTGISISNGDGAFSQGCAGARRLAALACTQVRVIRLTRGADGLASDEPRPKRAWIDALA